MWTIGTGFAGKEIEELKAENDRLAQHIVDLQKDKGQLTDKVKELKDQIEKMKCCGNCLHQYEGSYKNGIRCKDHLDEEVCSDWELLEESEGDWVIRDKEPL